jgi:hypothetical protein
VGRVLYLRFFLPGAFNELKNELLNLAQLELLTEGDIFGWFALKMRKGFDEKAFLWSDMAHYRRTSIIPARLIARARDMQQSADALTKEHGDQLLAFALGWTCHVGTDVIAHCFINEQCGGPFRTHWQRHHVIETTSTHGIISAPPTAFYPRTTSSVSNPVTRLWRTPRCTLRCKFGRELTPCRMQKNREISGNRCL